MRILLDTHVFLWHISADARLPLSLKVEIQDPTNEVYLSVASIWEAVVKSGLGRLPLPEPAAVYLPRQRLIHQILSLPIDEQSVAILERLPPHHRDPFDRILVAQALHHGLTLATLDGTVRAYQVSLLPV